MWAADGRRLDFAESGAGGLSRLMAAEISSDSDGPRATPPTPVVAGTYPLSTSGGSAQYAVAPSGRFIVPQIDERDRREAHRIHVTLNLMTELRMRLP